MTQESCRRWREMLGAYLLGHLTPDERVGLEAHLDGCAECRAELAELKPVASALSAADPQHLGTPPAPPAELGDRVLEHVRTAHRLHNRRRWALRIGAGVAAAVIAISVAVLVRPAPKVQKEEVAFTTAPAGVVAKATLYKRAAGVEVWLQVKGLKTGKTYALWVERTDGKHVECGTFYVVPGIEHVVLPSDVQRIDTVAVGVDDDLGHNVLRAPVGPPRQA